MICFQGEHSIEIAAFGQALFSQKKCKRTSRNILVIFITISYYFWFITTNQHYVHIASYSFLSVLNINKKTFR